MKYQLFDGTGNIIESIDYAAEVVDIPSLKAQKNMQINAWRAEANSSSFSFGGKLIACDPLSRSDIDAVASSIALNGDYPSNFPMQWKATDNTYVELVDIDSFKALHGAMVSQGTANFVRSEQLKYALSLASTQAEIEAIVW